MEFNFSKDIILENDRVILSPVNMSHLNDLLKESSQDEKLVQYSPYVIYNEQLLADDISKAIEARKNNIRYAFSIFDKKANRYVGNTSFGNISNKNQTIEIGWTWIGKNFQRSGLNRNCKFLLLSYAFEDLGFHRVELKTDERNKQSRTAIEKIGAKYEGCLRENTIMLDGFRRSTVYYSILNNEWPEIKSTIFKEVIT